MNRRSFFKTLGTTAASFMILPGAGRVWRPLPESFSFWPAGTGVSVVIEAGHYQRFVEAMLADVGIPSHILERMVASDAKGVVVGDTPNISDAELWCSSIARPTRNPFETRSLRDIIGEVRRRGSTPGATAIVRDHQAFPAEAGSFSGSSAAVVRLR